MPTLHIDLSQLDAVDPGLENLSDARIDFSPYRAFQDAETWVTRNIEKIPCPTGTATPFLPAIPSGNAFEVQERGFRGARHGYVIFADLDDVNYADPTQVIWVDKDTLDPIDPPSSAWQLYIDAQIEQAVTDLINGAPGALDTLKELADALGDDPNFATTITTLINTKASQANLDAETTARIQATADEVTARNSAISTAISTEVTNRNAAILAARTLTDVATTRTTNGALTIGKHNPVDATSGARTVTLADAGSAGLFASFEKTDPSTNTVTVTLNLRGSAGSIVLTSLSEARLFVSKADGSWWPIADHRTTTSLNALIAAGITGKADTTALTTEATTRAAAGAALSARDGAYKVATTEGLSAFVSSSGLAFTSSYYNATVGGTDGTGIFPIYDKLSSVSFRVKCTKGTASSKSYVGVCNTVQGTAPTGTTPTFGVGYKAGSGLCIIRENVGADIVLVADAALTDGDLYDLTITFDRVIQPASAQSANLAVINVSYAKSDGTGANYSNANVNLTFWPDMWNWFVRTNVAAGGVTLLTAKAPVSGTGGNYVGRGDLFYSSTASEGVFFRIPTNPNGMAVIALHGHGGNDVETGWTSSSYTPTWAALEAAGYSVFVPRLGGDLWGNNAAQTLLATLQGIIVNYFKLDPRVFLWGNSMGGGAALTAIGKSTIPVRAAYLAESVCDLSVLWANPSFTTLPAAYSNDTALRDANNPMSLPTANFAGVPMLFVASASDTTVVKTAHTDAFRTKLGSVNDNRLVLATGNHSDASEFKAKDTVAWFAANI